MGTWEKPNPLITPSVLRRTAAAGAAGLTMMAGACLGMGTAMGAETLVVDQPIAIVSGEAGQPIAVSPQVLDFKVNQAVLLAMPLNFSAASSASDQFAGGSPIPLGTAEPGANSYSGREIAAAATPRLSSLGLPEDKVEAVRFHFNNLVGLGNSITVNVPEPSEESSPPPSEEQPSPPPSEDEPQPTSPPSSAPAPAPSGPSVGGSVPTMPSLSGAPAAVSMLPPSLRGASLPWAQARYGQVPGMAPNVGDLARQAQERQRAQEEQEEIRAAGQAEAMPTEVSERVALPVLVAAISLAIVTAALVRAWVLRRH